MEIVKLDTSTYEQALQLRDTVFDELEPLEFETLEASICPQNFSLWYEKAGIKNLEYWVMQDAQNNLAGLVGLYTQTGDKKSKVWLGWYCVNPKYRGVNLGSKLLDFAIREAKEQSFQEMHLYTTKDDVYKKARELYEKRGFVKYKETKKNGNVYYKLLLK